MLKMEKMGYESVVVTSPGKQQVDFRKEYPQFRTIEVPMERHIAIFKDLWSLIRMIGLMIKERPYMAHSMTPKAELLTMLAVWLTGVPVRVHMFAGLVWPTATGGKRKVQMMSSTDWFSKANESWFINLETLNTYTEELIYLLKIQR